MWPQRQEVSQQKVQVTLVLMEGVERMNTVVVNNQGQRIGSQRRNSYAMEVDRGRNCYTCRGFEHMAWHCRNKGMGKKIGEGRRLEYGL